MNWFQFFVLIGVIYSYRLIGVVPSAFLSVFYFGLAITALALELVK